MASITFASPTAVRITPRPGPGGHVVDHPAAAQVRHGHAGLLAQHQLGGQDERVLLADVGPRARRRRPAGRRRGPGRSRRPPGAWPRRRTARSGWRPSARARGGTARRACCSGGPARTPACPAASPSPRTPAPLTLSSTTLNRLAAMPSVSTRSSTRLTCRACVSAFRLPGRRRSTLTYRAADPSYNCRMRAAAAGGGATASRVKNFSPFHATGLWLAVTTIPASAPRCRTIIATPGVVTTSRSTTSTPLAVSAATAASRTQGPLGRLSRPTTTVNGRPASPCSTSHAANAAAIRPTTGGVSDPPTVPPHPAHADHQCVHAVAIIQMGRELTTETRRHGGQRKGDCLCTPHEPAGTCGPALLFFSVPPCLRGELFLRPVWSNSL